jgi:hypothetical protein
VTTVTRLPGRFDYARFTDNGTNAIYVAVYGIERSPWMEVTSSEQQLKSISRS